MASLPALVYWEDPVQTGAVFGSVLVGLVSLYSCLALLTGVLLIKLYSFVMVKAGKAEAGSDPLAKVAELPLAIPADTISSAAPCLANAVNTAVFELRRLFLA